MNNEQDLIQIRRQLHQMPELELNTKKTADFIEAHLPDSFEIFRPLPNAVCAYMNADSDFTLAFRADMDALPITETTDFDWKANGNTMHACGHDAHMTMLLGFAFWLEGWMKEHGTPNINVLLVFQPGEEKPGGAAKILETGLFETYKVNEIYGMHVMPGMKAGDLATKPGPLMAGGSDLNVTFIGKSAHQANPELGINALEAACRFVERTLKEERAAFGPDTFHILGYGHLESGSVFNIIPEKAMLEGTIRYYDPAVFETICSILQANGKRLEEEMGVRFSMEIRVHYPPVLNDETLVKTLMEGNNDVALLDKPKMICEDFAFYQRKVPGVFMFIGTGKDISLHSDHFDLDESLLEKGVENYIHLFEMKNSAHGNGN